ncbi:MAG: hypothetical protein ACXAEI_12395 [Candidatus Hodarchaeales archaeon]
MPLVERYNLVGQVMFSADCLSGLGPDEPGTNIGLSPKYDKNLRKNFVDKNIDTIGFQWLKWIIAGGYFTRMITIHLKELEIIALSSCHTCQPRGSYA